MAILSEFLSHHCVRFGWGQIRHEMLSKQTTKPDILAQLRPYKSPEPTILLRGDYYGVPPSVVDVNLLAGLIAVANKVERSTVVAHSSVLHRIHAEFVRLLDESELCSETLWVKDMLQSVESVPSRRRVAGALSTVQFRGTGEFWSMVLKQLRRRVAEKALCKIRSLYEIRDSTRRQEYLAELAACIRLDPELQLGFATNGLDISRGVFVREPDFVRAEKLLCGIGAPLGAVPLPVRPRVHGVRLALDGQGP